MREIDHKPQKRQPFFGYNAKAFAIQFAVALFCLFVIAPLVAPSLRPMTDKAVEMGFDALCAIGLCSQEAAARRPS